ncbi:MAG: hypothetical protein J7M11_04280 [Elusimicrobia bacterium]|nr:hypothetical protein [Elusimicrobiota bacterium]
MNDFNDEIERKLHSPEWGADIARSVITRRKKIGKHRRFIAASAFSLLLLFGVSRYAYNTSRETLFENTLETAFTEFFFENGEDSFISQEIDSFIENWG